MFQGSEIAVIATAIAIFIGFNAYLFKIAEKFYDDLKDYWDKSSELYLYIEADTSIVRSPSFKSRLDKLEKIRDLISVLSGFSKWAFKLWTSLCIMIGAIGICLCIAFIVNTHDDKKDNLIKNIEEYLYDKTSLTQQKVNTTDGSTLHESDDKRGIYNFVREIVSAALKLFLFGLLLIIPPWVIFALTFLLIRIFNVSVLICFMGSFVTYIMGYDKCFRKHCSHKSVN